MAESTQTPTFLDPRSSITPSSAGALIVTVSVPLADLLQLSVKSIALPLSFLIGILITFSIRESMSASLRALYCVMNSLIIFSVSVGIGLSVDSPPRQPSLPPDIARIMEKVQRESPASGYFEFGIPGIGSALAQTDEQSSSSSSTGTGSRSGNTEGSSSQPAEGRAERPSTSEGSLTRDDIEKLKRYLQEQSQYKAEQEKYNRRWSWGKE